MSRKHAISRELPHLRRYALGLCGNRDDADDLVQDCLEKALARIAQWREGDSPRKWLFTILHNTHIDRVRKDQRRPVHSSIDDELERGGRFAATLPGQHGHRALREFDKAVGQLPMEQRRAVLLVGLEGMSYRDAAEIMEIPVGTLMSRLGRGRETLRRALGETPRPRTALRRVK